MFATAINVFGADTLILLAVPIGIGLLIFLLLRKRERRDPPSPPPPPRDDQY